MKGEVVYPGREILRRDRGATTRQKNDERESCITRFGRQLRKFQFIPVSKGLVHPFKCHASATNAPNEKKKKAGDFYAFRIRYYTSEIVDRGYICTTGKKCRYVCQIIQMINFCVCFKINPLKTFYKFLFFNFYI